MGKGVIIASVLFLGLSIPAGCAIKQVSQLPAHEQARFYVDQLGQSYIDLHNGYLEVWPSLTISQQEWFSKNLKPVMSKAKITIDMAIGAAKAWSISAGKCEVAQGKALSTGDNSIKSDSAELAATATDLAKCETARIEYEALAHEAMDLLESAQKLYNEFKSEV